ncbi:MAG: rane-associated protein [Chloroflexota bacterium]|nr:rane-associated protein [Chloroflexota bacterium]
MDLLANLFHLITDPHALIQAFGPWAYLGLFAVVFAETGLFVGFFLPGDSLLFAAGLFAALQDEPRLELPIVIGICITAAILGNLTGFAFGRKVGRRLYARPDSRFFKREHLVAAERFYEKHGGKTIIFARFLPFIRTFAPIVAGASSMAMAPFIGYTVVGGILWGAGVPVAGYLLGKQIPDIDRYLLPIVILIVAISLLPAIVGAYRGNRDRIDARLGRRRGHAGPPVPDEPIEP